MDSLFTGSTLQRVLIALVQVLALAVWFSASAVVPSLEQEWGITAAEAVWLTASVQVGFVVGAVCSAATNLADSIPPRLLLAASATGAAACTAAVALFSTDLASAVPLRLATGVFLAGVYPVGMKLMASWSTPANRGRWFGVLLGALTLGSALPHLIGGFGLPWRAIMLTAAGITLVAAMICLLWVRRGPQVSGEHVRPSPAHLIELFRDRRQQLANLGYFGHMWELYAMWTWLPTFAVLSVGEAGVSAEQVSLGVFLAIGVAGVFGCLLGGWAADRLGRRRTAMIALATSGACCLLTPLAFSWTWAVLLPFAMVWGASVIADSGVFSTMVSEVAESRYVGTALTAQTAIGFLLTVVTIQIVPLVATFVTWQYAFLALVPGPVVGVLAMRAFPKREQTAVKALA